MKAVFGVEDSPEEAEPSVEQAASGTRPAEAATAKQVEEGTQALERALEEIGEIHIPAPPVEAVHSDPPHLDPPGETGEESAKAPAPVPGGPAVPDDVKELTEKFMEQKERNDRREATPAQQLQYQTAGPAKAYCFPPVTMLAVSPHGNPVQETEELQTNGRILVDTLKSFGVQTKILDICRGPSVTRYEISPLPA